MNDGSETPVGCTTGGTGGALTPIFGNANASRSPDTDDNMRVNTTPATPVSAPAPRKPSVTKDSRRPRSGESGSCCSGASVNRPEVSSRRTATPQTVPATVGTTSAAVAPARDSTAAQPTIPATTIAALPTGLRRVSHRAVTAAIRAITPSTTTVRNNLSEVPKL